jgi:hypothetical protein
MPRRTTTAVRLLSGEREPVLVATTANITLSGLQTVDGVALANGNRVLVKNQSAGKDNGIYTASTGPWRRSRDAGATRFINKGVTVRVQSGSTNGGKYFRFDTLDPNIGTDAILISEVPLETSDTFAGLADVDMTGLAHGDVPVWNNATQKFEPQEPSDPGLSSPVAIADGGTGQTTAAGAFGALKQAATTTATGVVELATNAETVTGTDTERAVTPAGVAAALAALPGASAAFWKAGQVKATAPGTDSAQAGTHYSYSDTTPPTISQEARKDDATIAYAATATGTARLRFQYAGTVQGSLEVINGTVHYTIIAALFRDSEADAIAWAVCNYQVTISTTTGTTTRNMGFNVAFLIDAGDTASHTYHMRVMAPVATGGQDGSITAFHNRIFTLEERT